MKNKELERIRERLNIRFKGRMMNKFEKEILDEVIMVIFDLK